MVGSETDNEPLREALGNLEAAAERLGKLASHELGDNPDPAELSEAWDALNEAEREVDEAWAEFRPGRRTVSDVVLAFEPDPDDPDPPKIDRLF